MQQEIAKKSIEVPELETKDMEIGDLDLEGLEATHSDKIPAQIPPHQVSLLEKVII